MPALRFRRRPFRRKPLEKFVWTRSLNVTGQVVSLFTFSEVVSARLEAKSRVDQPFTFGRVVQAKVTAKSRVDCPFTFGIVVSGTVSAAPEAPTTRAFSFYNRGELHRGMQAAVDGYGFDYWNRAEPLRAYGEEVAGAATHSGRVDSPFTFGRVVAGDIPLTGYPAAVVADGAVAYWRLGDSGSTAEEVISGHDGTYTGGYTQSQTGALVGDSDTAVLLNGSTGYVSVPGSTPDLAGAPMTFETWIKVTTAAISEIYGGYDSSGSPYHGWGVAYHFGPLLGTGTTHRIHFYESTSPGWVESTGTVTADGNWHHIAVVVGDGSVTFYIDGVAAGSASVGLPGSYSGAKAIGARSDGARPFPGSMDEVALYDYALTFAQILEHYQLGQGVGGGQVDSPFTFGRVVSGKVEAKSRVDSPFTFGEVIAGRAVRFGQVVSPFTFSEIVAGTRVLRGFLVTPFTFSEVVQAKVTAKGRVDSPFTFGRVVDGTVAGTQAGVVISPFTFGEVVSGRVTAKSRIDSPFTFGRVVQAKVTAKSSVVSPFTFDRVVQAKLTAKSAVVFPVSFNRVTQAKLTAKGQVVCPFTFGIVTISRGGAGAVVSPFTFGRVVTGHVHSKTNPVVTAFTFGETISGRLGARSAVVSPFTFDRVTQVKVTARSAVVLAFTFDRLAQAKVTAKSRVALPIVFGVFSQAQAGAGGSVSSPFTFGRVVSGQVTLRRGAVVSPFTFSETVSGALYKRGRVVYPLTFDVDALAVLGAMGRVDAPFLWLTVTEGTWDPFLQTLGAILGGRIGRGFNGGIDDADEGRIAVGVGGEIEE